MRRIMGWLGMSALAGLVMLGTIVQADDKDKKDAKVPPDKLPKAVLDSIKGRFPGADITGAEKETENNRTAAVRIRNMIAALERAVSSLNASIDAILEGSQVRDPTSFAYPVTARAMCARRDNIQSTIAVLSRQLAKINDPETDF